MVINGSNERKRKRDYLCRNNQGENVMADKNYFDFTDYKTRKGFNIVRPLCNLCCNTRVKLIVEGEENLNREDGFIIAANHSIA